MTGPKAGDKAPPERLSHDTIVKLCGDIGDQRAAAILASGATVAELEAALAWAAGESDVMGEARRALEGNAARLYDILVADEEAWREAER